MKHHFCPDLKDFSLCVTINNVELNGTIPQKIICGFTFSCSELVAEKR